MSMAVIMLPGMRARFSLHQVVKIAQPSHTLNKMGRGVETPPCISVDIDRYWDKCSH